jgi:hypothetical protein
VVILAALPAIEEVAAVVSRRLAVPFELLEPRERRRAVDAHRDDVEM